MIKMDLIISLKIKNLPDDLTLYNHEKLFSEELKDTKEAVMSTHEQTLLNLQSGLRDCLQNRLENYFSEDIFEDIQNNEDLPLIDSEKLEFQIDFKTIADSFFKAKKELLEQVGLVTDWVECPIDDTRDMYWKVNSGLVIFSPDKTFQDTSKLYEDEIYTQRFYPKHVYRGKEITLIFCDPHVDGCQWWRIFDSKKEIKE